VKVTRTELPGVLVFELQRYEDARGWLAEAWHDGRYAAHGLPATFAQDNVAFSHPGVLRGLHLQHPEAQGKLVQVLSGEVFDVAVDVRVGSPTFGRWVGVALAVGRQMWLPAGLAHGYCVPGPNAALIQYKLSAAYRAGNELTLRWDDPALAIRWPARAEREKPWTLSAKDAAAATLAAVDRSRLPSFADYP
jgi:dTDP-4-dehydrorhamnose 3,5-epimerase